MIILTTFLPCLASESTMDGVVCCTSFFSVLGPVLGCCVTLSSTRIVAVDATERVPAILWSKWTDDWPAPDVLLTRICLVLEDFAANCETLGVMWVSIADGSDVTGPDKTSETPKSKTRVTTTQRISAATFPVRKTWTQASNIIFVSRCSSARKRLGGLFVKPSRLCRSGSMLPANAARPVRLGPAEKDVWFIKAGSYGPTYHARMHCFFFSNHPSRHKLHTPR